MPLPLLFLLSALFVVAFVLLIKAAALYRKTRFLRIKKDCQRALATLQRDVTHYARRDPALLHAELLQHIAEDFEVCVRDLAAKKLSRRKARNIYLTLERRAQVLTRLYEQSAADRADYSDQSNAQALLCTVIPQALARVAEQLDRLTEEQLDLFYKARAEVVRLKVCASSANCDHRILYAECALLHVRLIFITTLC